MSTSIVLVMKDIVDSMKVPVYGKDPIEYHLINYEPGRSSQIVKALNDLDNGGEDFKNLKYPLIAMLLPIRETRGGMIDTEVRIERITIATLTKTGTRSESVLEKYDQLGVFNTILFPCYYELLNRIARSSSVMISDPAAIPHTYMEMPAQLPVTQGVTDFVDSIEIYNMELILQSPKNC